MNDVTLGYKVLNAFLKYFNPRYGRSYSADQVAQAIMPKSPQILIDGLGLQFRVVLGSDESKLDSAMKYLAELAENRIPSLSSFSAIISREAQRGDTWQSIFEEFSFVVAESTKEIGNGAAKIGETIIATGNLLRLLLPIAVIGFGYIYLRNKVNASK